MNDNNTQDFDFPFDSEVAGEGWTVRRSIGQQVFSCSPKKKKTLFNPPRGLTSNQDKRQKTTLTLP